MIKLKSDCEKCMHSDVCKYKNNAKNDMERLSLMTYGDGPNDDYNWSTMSESRHVNITFSCDNYRPMMEVSRR